MARPGTTTEVLLEQIRQLLATTGIIISSEVEVKNDTGNPIPANITQFAGTTVTTGAGAVTAGTPRVTHASDDPAVTALQTMDDWDESDRAKVNIIVGQVGVQGNTGTVSANTQRVVLATDVALPTGTNTIGNINLSATSASIGPDAFRSLVVDTDEVTVKGSAGNLYGWNIVNRHTSTIYVKFYNQTSVDPGTDVPVLTLQVPANGSIYQEPNCIQHVFSTAIAVRAVTENTDTGTTDPTTLPIIEIKYK